MQRFAKSRLLSIDHNFRRSPVWSFFMLDRLIKNNLYFDERKRKQRARARAGQQAGPASAVGALSTEGLQAAGPAVAAAGPAQSPSKSRGTKRSASDADLPQGPEGELRGRDVYAELFGRVDPRHIPESASGGAPVRRSSWPSRKITSWD